jgi:peptide chain release factor subunit 3
LNLTVVNIGGNWLAQLCVPSCLHVNELKARVSELVDIPAEWQQLVANSDILEDSATLEMQGLAEHATLTLLQQPHKPHLDVVFLGHCHVGKSTVCDHILRIAGCMDGSTIETCQRQARDRNFNSWLYFYLWAGDLSDDETRDRRRVVKSTIGRAKFATQHCRFSILEAPRFRNYETTMLRGACQTDIAVLIVSARQGEFEMGLDRGGATLNHIQIGKTLGVWRVIVAINKMDDPSVDWNKCRYDEVVGKLQPLLVSTGFHPKNCSFLPTSGLHGDNVAWQHQTPSWYTGKTLLDMLDSQAACDPVRTCAPFQLPIWEAFWDAGATMAVGKVEQGTLRPDTDCCITPTGQKCSVKAVLIDGQEVRWAPPGETVALRLSEVTPDELRKGYMLCPLSDPLQAVSKFKAKLKIVNMLPECPVMTAGYHAEMHVHAAIEACEILKLYEVLDLENNTSKKPLFACKGSSLVCSIALLQPVALTAARSNCSRMTFESLQRLRCFTLWNQGMMIATGKIIQLPNRLRNQELVRGILKSVYESINQLPM